LLLRRHDRLALELANHVRVGPDRHRRRVAHLLASEPSSTGANPGRSGGRCTPYRLRMRGAAGVRPAP
jgi:hypothetical protein